MPDSIVLKVAFILLGIVVISIVFGGVADVLEVAASGEAGFLQLYKRPSDIHGANDWSPVTVATDMMFRAYGIAGDPWLFTWENITGLIPGLVTLALALVVFALLYRLISP